MVVLEKALVAEAEKAESIANVIIEKVQSNMHEPLEMRGLLRHSCVRYTQCLKVDLARFKGLLASDTEDWKIYHQDLKASI